MEIFKLYNSLVWKLTDGSLLNALQQKTNNLYHQTDNIEYNKFPGCQPVSIERKHINMLTETTYLVCEKTDGVRYLFVCLKHNDINYCFLYSRKSDIYLLNFSLNKSNFDNTILDGEIIKNETDDKSYFVVFDSIIVNNINLHNKTYKERLEHINLVTDTYLKKDTDHFEIKKKHIINYSPYTFHEYIKSLLNLNYKTDGFIFTPNNDSIKTGTHNTMFKFKKQYDNSVDFIIKYENNMFRIYIQNRLLYNNYIWFDHNVFEIEEEIKKNKQCVVECKLYSQEGINNLWYPVLIRTDKHHSNSFFCYKKTLLNIKENITIEEFYSI